MPPSGRGPGRGGRGRGRGPQPRRGRGAPAGGGQQPDERVWEDLQRFAALALEADALEAFGLPPDEAADLLLEAPAGADPVDALAPRIASLERARAAADLLARTRDDPALGPAERRAAAAALRLAQDCIDDGALPDHPLWEVLLGVSLHRALATGAVFERLLSSGLDLDWAASAIARAAADPAAREALAAAGGRVPDDPAAAAERLGDLVQEEELLPALGTDAILHLLRARHEVLLGEGEALLAEGLTPARREALAARLDAAARADLTPEVVAEVRDATLALLRAAAPADRDAYAALFLTAAAPVPPHENQLLRGLQGEALRHPFLTGDEEDLAVAVWADPLDRAALEAYERHLRARTPARAERVRRYSDALGG